MPPSRKTDLTALSSLGIVQHYIYTVSVNFTDSILSSTSAFARSGLQIVLCSMLSNQIM